MRKKRGNGALSGGAVGGMAILLFILAFTLVYIVVIPSDYVDELNISRPAEYTSVVFEEAPGKLYSAEKDEVREKTYTYEMNDVDLDNTPKEGRSFLLSQGLVKKSAISADVLNFDFNVEDLNDVDKISLDANVLKKEGGGSLIVKLNGITIYSKEVRKNKNIDIKLPSHYLEENNTLRITTSSPGWAFWSVNSYLLSDIYLVKETYSKDSAEAKRRVTLDSDVMDEVQGAKFVSYVKQLSSSPHQLEISVNGNEVYRRTPSDSEIETDVPTSYLASGLNSFYFEAARKGKYRLKYIYLRVKARDVKEENIAEYSFSISEPEWEKVKDENYECELYVEKSVGDNSITINLNNNVLKYTFDGKTLSKDVCERLREGENSITLTPKEELHLDTAALTIQNK